MKRVMILLIVILISKSTFAHQQKEAYINLLFNKHTGNLEVSHRFLIHDAEHIFGQLFDIKSLELSGDLLTDELTQAAFAAYVETHFVIADDDLNEIPLTSVGFEADKKFLWIYQETTIPKTTSVNVKHTALHELWPRHTNHVNVEIEGQVSSIRLQKQDGEGWHTIPLPN